MFPISWGVVELESAGTWKWFLDHLMADPNVANGGEGHTIFPDMKGDLLHIIIWYLSYYYVTFY
jgi:hypothetical protein